MPRSIRTFWHPTFPVEGPTELSSRAIARGSGSASEKRISEGKRRTSIARAKKQRRISELKARSKRGESEGTARKTLLKRSEKALYPTARAGTEKNGAERSNNGEERSEHTASLQNLQRNFGGISEESRSDLGVIPEEARRNNGASIQRAYRTDGETTENRQSLKLMRTRGLRTRPRVLS